MNKKALKTLEFDKIIDKLTALASTPLGKDLCKSLTPSIDLNEIEHTLTETNDALAMVLKKGSLSFSGTKDIRSSIMRLEVGSVLSIEEILAVSSLLNVTLRVKGYTRKENLGNSVHNEEEEYTATNSLSHYFEALEPLSNVNTEIKNCIISAEEISDDASSTLRQIRKSIKNTNNKVHEQFVNFTKYRLNEAQKSEVFAKVCSYFVTNYHA